MHTGRDDQGAPNYPEQTVIEMQKLRIRVDSCPSCEYQEISKQMTDHEKEHHDPSQSHDDLLPVRGLPEIHDPVRIQVHRGCTHRYVPPLLK
jgi:hypothetical protein